MKTGRGAESRHHTTWLGVLKTSKGRWLAASHSVAFFLGALVLIGSLGAPPASRTGQAADREVAALPPVSQTGQVADAEVAALPPVSQTGQAADTEVASLPLAQEPEEALPDPSTTDDQAAAPAPEAPKEIRRTVTARRGDTFMKLMLSAGASRGDAYAAIKAMRPAFNPRGLHVGQDIAAVFHVENGDNPEDPNTTFMGFRFSPAAGRIVSVMRNGTGFSVKTVQPDLHEQDTRIAGRISSSLYNAAANAGMPASVLVDMIRLLSWDVDFQRDVQPGDSFDALVERFYRDDGQPARWGDILYAELELDGKPIRLYRYETERHGIEYFDEEGRSAAKALMKTPIDGARLSSGFGMRRHPILGYTLMHRGVDFAAPMGTPIYAAGNGRISYAGRKGGYGRFILIRHNATYSTAYGHLSRYARGLHSGTRVRQGQVIGYVGSSGRSTGPHLHYEVRINGHQVNPLKLKLPSGRALRGRELVAFRKLQASLDQRIAALPKGTLTASR